MGAKIRIFVSRKKSHDQNLKHHFFPKEFFSKIWLKVREHECIYIFEIEFEKKNILFQNDGQNKFRHIAR